MPCRRKGARKCAHVGGGSPIKVRYRLNLFEAVITLLTINVASLKVQEECWVGLSKTNFLFAASQHCFQVGVTVKVKVTRVLDHWSQVHEQALEEVICNVPCTKYVFLGKGPDLLRNFCDLLQNEEPSHSHGTVSALTFLPIGGVSGWFFPSCPRITLSSGRACPCKGLHQS